LIAKMELRLVDGQGTNIGDALGTAVARLRKSTSESKIIILLTDGDSNAGSIAPEYAADLALRQKVAVYTVQIGNGDDVEVFRGYDLLGEPAYQRARYPVNPALLRDIASKTGGDSFVANDGLALEQSMRAILAKLEKTKMQAPVQSYLELFMGPLTLALALLFMEFVLRATWLRRDVA
jgi:Ca-activated chloride channel homolog